MDDERRGRELFAVLYEAAFAAGVEVIQDRLNRSGGVCRVNGRVHVIFDERAPYREKNRLIVEGMAMIDHDAAYLPPRVRELLAAAPGGPKGAPGTPGSDEGWDDR
jgi:hypothetical protein